MFLIYLNYAIPYVVTKVNNKKKLYVCFESTHSQDTGCVHFFRKPEGLVSINITFAERQWIFF